MNKGLQELRQLNDALKQAWRNLQTSQHKLCDCELGTFNYGAALAELDGALLVYVHVMRQLRQRFILMY